MTTAATAKARWSCCSCQGELDEAKVLPCLHSVCATCLALSRQNDGSLFCGECKTSISAEQLDRLKFDYLARDQFVLRQLASSDVEKAFACEACAGPEVASAKCLDCNQFLCEVHQRAHASSKAAHSHKIMTVTDLHSSLQAALAGDDGSDHGENTDDLSQLALVRSDTLLCAQHDAIELWLYCKNCSEFVCRDCINAEHKSHEHTFPEDVLDEAIALRQDIGDCEQALPMLADLQDIVNSSMQVLVSNVNRIAQESLENAIGDATRLVECRARQLHTDLIGMYDSKLKALDKQANKLASLIEQLDYAAEFVKSAVRHCTPTQCLALKGTADAHMTRLLDVANHLWKPPDKYGELRIEFGLFALPMAQKIVKQLGEVSSTTEFEPQWLIVKSTCYTVETVTVKVVLDNDTEQSTADTDADASAVCDACCMVVGPDSRPQDVRLLDRADGAASAAEFAFVPDSGPGVYYVSVVVAGEPIHRATATITALLAPWTFRYRAKSYVLQEEGNDDAVKISSCGRHIHCEDESPQQCDDDCAPPHHSLRSLSCWHLTKPYRVIIADTEIQKSATEGWKWQLRIERQKACVGRPVDDQPAFGVGMLVNVTQQDIMDPTLLEHTPEAPFQLNTAICFSTGMACCSLSQCLMVSGKPGACGDGGQTTPWPEEAAFQFQNGGNVSMEYCFEHDFLIISHSNQDVKCIIDLVSRTMQLVPSTADNAQYFMITPDRERLQSKVGYKYGRGSRGSMAMQSYGCILSVLPVVWVAADCVCDVHLDFSLPQESEGKGT
ncbi:E3 ubiquitin-protein ligase TRIM71-like [Sycon ciliatum]|uniref:E3 ubiquitin-protein ligase TRIM71-like n=1 Tax=Sycon ciliatum TaxID=27933 RepID=UPI0031F6BC58